MKVNAMRYKVQIAVILAVVVFSGCSSVSLPQASNSVTSRSRLLAQITYDKQNDGFARHY
jgi:uncharacterized protein YceK